MHSQERSLVERVTGKGEAGSSRENAPARQPENKKDPSALTSDEELARFLQQQENLLARDQQLPTFQTSLYDVHAIQGTPAPPSDTEGMTEDELFAWRLYQEEMGYGAGGAVQPEAVEAGATDFGYDARDHITRTPLAPMRSEEDTFYPRVVPDTRDQRIADEEWDDEEEEWDEVLSDDEYLLRDQTPQQASATQRVTTQTVQEEEREEGEESEGEEEPLPTGLLGEGDEAYELLLRLGEWAPPVSKGVEESALEKISAHTMTKEKIEELRKSNSDPSADCDEEEDSFVIDCNICLGEFDVGEECKTLPCQHVYHGACIDRWLLMNKICPVCRLEIQL